MHHNVKRLYEPPCMGRAVPLTLEGSLLVVDSVKATIDNDGQEKDGWYEGSDMGSYWD